MNILVLNGSPRQNGNTKKLIAAFTEGAESVGNTVNIVDVCKKNIKGCLACEYCHTKGNGKCIQKDDMGEIYGLLANAEMLVLASPIYYHGISGQLKCVIDRFYSAAYPNKPKRLKKIAMFLCSGDRDMYDGAMFSFKGDFLDYLGLENAGVITVAGSVTQNKLAEANALGKMIPSYNRNRV
ncbi:MAG: flavodoxin family protein [Clostridia bacterium]|nr:flavodoxin family protein [Clostridia bacterium]